MNFKNLNIEKLKRDAENFSVSGNDSYIESYPEFLKYFEYLELIEKHHLIISSHFVYGWMPTVIHLDTKNIEKVLVLLNAAKSGQELKLDELEILKYCINNSMVGLSKLLHFMNPRDYAIWDSRIFKYLTGKKSQYGIDKVKNYSAYLEEIKKLTQHPDYPNLHFKIERNFDYSITPMRAVEILMFETNRNEKIMRNRFTYTSDLGLNVIHKETEK
ncbi:hypothetical protein [Draconibacterium orientale]|uniref:hypothetical protein n=1 Tax=Draconibacterium orientale TaxID=1168034 RepID=UPI002ABD224D|nr:hypothetical protein [Draconibacterium orientale]